MCLFFSFLSCLILVRVSVGFRVNVVEVRLIRV